MADLSHNTYSHPDARDELRRRVQPNVGSVGGAAYLATIVGPSDIIELLDLADQWNGHHLKLAAIMDQVELAMQEGDGGETMLALCERMFDIMGADQ